jgi:hypothetical protein
MSSLECNESFAEALVATRAGAVAVTECHDDPVSELLPQRFGDFWCGIVDHDWVCGRSDVQVPASRRGARSRVPGAALQHRQRLGQLLRRVATRPECNLQRFNAGWESQRSRPTAWAPRSVHWQRMDPRRLVGPGSAFRPSGCRPTSRAPTRARNQIDSRR